jgi:hypothetical protein
VIHDRPFNALVAATNREQFFGRRLWLALPPVSL